MAKLRPEDIIFKKKIKQRLVNLINAQGDSKSNISKGVDVDRQNLNPWTVIDAKRGITIYSLNRLCKALQISLSEFFDDPLFYEESANPDES